MSMYIIDVIRVASVGTAVPVPTVWYPSPLQYQKLHVGGSFRDRILLRGSVRVRCVG